jgi:hypothetical protein
VFDVRQRGPKNDAKYFLDIVNFETLLRFLFKFTPDTEKPLLKKRLPRRLGMNCQK